MKDNPFPNGFAATYPESSFDKEIVMERLQDRGVKLIWPGPYERKNHIGMPSHAIYVLASINI